MSSTSNDRRLAGDTTSGRACDCLDHCGDDPRVDRGVVDPCPRMLAWRARPRIVGVRHAGSAEPHALVVLYDKPPTDDDVVYLRTRERWPSP